MAAESYVSVNGERAIAARVHVGPVGPWVADVDFEGESQLAGRVTLTIGELTLSGTIAEELSGTFARQTRVRIVGGAGAWGDAVTPKAYHNDGGVKARLVADDAARAVGETIGDFIPRDERVGRDYARQDGSASRALEDVIGGVPWWVDYAGVTHVGSRPTEPLADAAYTVVAFDPRDRVATLAVDDPGVVRVGSKLRKGFDGERTVRAYELRVTADELRVRATFGGPDIAGLIRSIVARATDGRLHGHYRYRVIRMAAAGRVELQAVRKRAGLPDLLPLSVWPGVAGSHAELTPGAECLVCFVEGDRSQPVVVAHVGVDGPGFTPTRLTLGGKEGPAAARQGDLVEVQFTSIAFTGTATVGGSPAPVTGIIATGKALGIITGGSARVRVAT